MTEILMIYQKIQKKIDFFHFFGDNSKTIGDIDTKSVPNYRERSSEKIYVSQNGFFVIIFAKKSKMKLFFFETPKSGSWHYCKF